MAEKDEKLEGTDRGDTEFCLELSCKLWVKDRFVDAQGVDDIMEEVFQMRLKNRDHITDALMAKFLLNNRINEELSKDYRAALIDEYERRQLPYL